MASPDPGIGYAGAPALESPSPSIVSHREGSRPYAGRTGDEDTSTQWRTSNVFEHCVSVRLDGARGLPEAIEMRCEAQVGPRLQIMPLLLSQADLESGGGGRIDGGQLSERVNLLSEEPPEELELRLLLKAHGPMWTKRTQKFVGRCVLDGRWYDALANASTSSIWIPLRPAAPDGGDGGGEVARRHGFAGPRGPALLVRVQCFERIDLHSSESREHLFALYSANGLTLSAAEFDHLMEDISNGRRGAAGVLDVVTAPIVTPAMKGGCCRVCVAHLFAGVGLYRPEASLLAYLMYYHTLMWVVCRAPGEEHIPICHRLSFVLLSMAFNLLVVVLFTATDMSLVSIYCPDNNRDEICSPFALNVWDATQVLLVAVIDTAFWPLLKRAFYFVEDVISGRDRLGLPDCLWRLLRYLLIALGAALLTWVCISVARHHRDLASIFSEFLSTWPTARVTETFKLMSLWGVLFEYGMPEPRTERQSSTSTSSQPISKVEAESDPKRVPLLSAQHP